METKRVQLDLSEQEHAEMERLMAQAGLKTKREFVSNALTLFKWAANAIASGRCVATVDANGGAVKELEMPCLQAFAAVREALDKRAPSAAELKGRSERGGIPAEQVLAEMRKLLESAHVQPQNPSVARSPQPVG